MLNALALRYTRGYAAAAPHLVAALDGARVADVGAEEVGDWFWLSGNRGIGIVAIEVWDHEAALELAARQERTARATGALVQLQFALNFRAEMLVRDR